LPPQIYATERDDLNAVIRSALPGTQLVLMPGRYDGNCVVDRPLEITGDGSGEAITFNAETGSCLRVASPCTLIWGLKARAVSNAVTLLDIEADDVAIDECVLTGGKTTVRVRRNNITLNRCVIRDGSVGLYLDHCGEVDVVDCTIQDNHRMGVLCTNLEKYTRLIACELSHNKECGLATSYSTDFRYTGLHAPALHRCVVHHNGTDGIRITDPILHTPIQECRVFDNGGTQIVLKAMAYVDWCDISGGMTGIAIVAGEDVHGPAGSPQIRDCNIHDVPVGISVMDPDKKAKDPVLLYGTRIYNTADIASRVSNGGKVNLLGCVVRDNAYIGVDVDTGCKQDVSQCRVVRNDIGMLVRSGGAGRVTESIINRNANGLVAQSGGRIDASYCHIKGHNHTAVIFEAGAEGYVSDCTFESNTAGNIWQDPLSEVSVHGDPAVDHLAKRQGYRGDNIKIPTE
jgi:hypothetical protein